MRHFKRNWEWQAKTPLLQATIHINLSAKGEVTQVKIIQSSGDLEFDKSVLQTVKAASPVPPLPVEYVKMFETVRITFDNRDEN